MKPARKAPFLVALLITGWCFSANIYNAFCEDRLFFTQIAELLGSDDPEVILDARKTILAIPDWKKHVSQLATSTERAKRIQSASILILDPSDQNLAQAFSHLFSDPDAGIRSRAFDLVPAWKTGPHLGLVLEALAARVSAGEPDPSSRYSLVFALAQMADEKCLSALVKASADESSLVREAAIHGLGNLTADGNPATRSAMKHLLDIAKNGDDRERVIAFHYVGRHGGPSGGDLLAKIAAEDGSQAVKSAAKAAVKP